MVEERDDEDMTARKKRRLTKNALKAFQIIGIILVLAGTINLGRLYLQDQRYRQSVSELKVLSERVDSSVEEGLSLEEALIMRNEELRSLNEDYVGWINIPFSDIDFPFVLGDDNDYYLNYDYKKKRHAYGAIFMDYRNTSELNEEHIILYGHSVKTESMFGPLNRFKDPDYLNGRNIIKVVTEDKILEYQIFSVQVVDADVTTLDNPASITDVDKLYQSFKEKSLYEIAHASEDITQILSLVSCEYSYENGRILIHATLINEQALH